MFKESVPSNTDISSSCEEQVQDTLIRGKNRICHSLEPFRSSLTNTFLHVAQKPKLLRKEQLVHSCIALAALGSIFFITSFGKGIQHENQLPPPSIISRGVTPSLHTSLPSLIMTATPTISRTAEITDASIPLFTQTPSSVIIATPPVTPTETSINCTYTQGVKVLADTLIKDGIDVGNCVENIHYDAIGNGLQVTTKGQFNWDKLKNMVSFTDNQHHHYPEFTPTPQAPSPLLTPLSNPPSLSESRIIFTVRIDYPFTREEIISAIDQDFKNNAQDALKVATCESGLRPDIARVNRNKDGSLTIDYGVFQIDSIHEDILGKQFETDPRKNIQDAYLLYKEQGWQPWYSSNSCHHLLTSPTPTYTPTPVVITPTVSVKPSKVPMSPTPKRK